MQLSEVARLCQDEILDHAAYLTSDPPMSESGRVIEELSRLCQAYAICMLLDEADDQQFREHLRRSACAQRYFRRKSAVQGNTDDRHLGISRSEAFLDALVAGELQLARDLVMLSPTEWHEGWEYEDDYCYYRLLHQMLEQGERFSAESASDWLQRFEQVLEGEASPRWDICQAFAVRDLDGLRAPLYDLLGEKATRDDARRPNIVSSGFLFWPQSFVSIEALALLRLAELLGMPINDSFPFCPVEARLPLNDQPFTDIFQQLEEAIAADG